MNVGAGVFLAGAFVALSVGLVGLLIGLGLESIASAVKDTERRP